ncbi:MAG: alpha/beta fold hydrolase [Anaerolineae bacterium]
MKKLLLFVLSLTLQIASFPLAYVQAQTSIVLTPCKLEIGLSDPKTEIDAQCGVLPVPENRSDPNSRMIDIHFTVLPAQNQQSKQEPIFHFEGGPGGSAISNFTVWYTSYRPLMPDHDIVLIDQRGTGTSSSIQCTEITDKALDDLKQASTSAEDTDLLVERMQACLTRLSKTTDPANYNSVTMADDTDAVRAALGYDKINLFGNSYGTWLAQFYIGRHGDHVNAAVLDSVGGPWNFYLLDATHNIEASLKRVFELCAEDTQCNALYPDLAGKFEQALSRLEEKSVSTVGSGLTGLAIPVVMTRDRLLNAFAQLLYQSAYIGSLPQAITQAAAGSYTLPASILVGAAEQSGDISEGLYYSVHCAESLPLYSEDVLGRYSTDQYYGLDVIGAEQLKRICAVWRGGELSEAELAPVRSGIPVLILSGAFDPITPVSFGEETKSRFSNSTLAVFPYQAHGLMPSSKCAQNIIRAFYATPTATLDTSCVADDLEPVFTGTVKLTMKPFRDAASPVQLMLPEGWLLQTDKITDQMAFFESPDGLQLLGAGIYRAKTAAEARQMAEQAIAQAYGAVDTQATISLMGSLIVQQGLMTLGMFILRSR